MILSVCVVTYNQVNYIEKCIYSLINQNVNFEYNILISDDYSTDGTREILLEIKKKYPNLIKLFLQDKNIGPYENFYFIHDQANSDYVAHCDGDDYYYPNKLLSQKLFLDSNINCVIVWHRMHILINGKIYEDNYKKMQYCDTKYYQDALLNNITIGNNSSKMYRKSIVRNLNKSDYKLDFYFNFSMLNNSSNYASFVDDNIYGVYRAGIGISKHLNKEINIMLYKYLFNLYKKNNIHKKYISSKFVFYTLLNLRHFNFLFFYSFFYSLCTFRNFNPIFFYNSYKKKLKYKYLFF
jgi:glycosyltransferase involved in cell wall biosynthesis